MKQNNFVRVSIDGNALQKFVENGQAAQAAAEETIRLETGYLPVNKLRSINPTPLLCRSAVRQCLLDAAKQHRPFNKFNRVSEETLIAANEAVRQFLVSHVKRMPSKGRTL
jgi:hypothetical protein